MKTVHLLTVLAAVTALTLTLGAQQPPARTGADQNSVEEAHQDLLRSSTDPAKEVSDFTERMAQSLPDGEGGADRILRKTFIDEMLFGRMKRDGIPHAGLSADAEFIRRLYVDLTGMLPSPDAVREFVADESPDKRDRVVDMLIGSDGFVEQWAWFFGDMYKLNGRAGPAKNSFHFLVREWLRTDRPYNEFVYDLMTGVAKTNSTVPGLGLLTRNNQGQSRLVGSGDDYSAMNRLDTLDEFATDTARIFLGMNLTCISCHDGAGHLESVELYLTGKTRTEFYRQSAFLGKTRIITTWDDRSKNIIDDLIIDDLARGYDTANDAPFWTDSENRFPRDGRFYTPAFILTGEEPRPDHNPRAELARMMTDHIQFSRATVNLIWGKLMTLAFVEPYDTFDLDRLNPDNPPPAPWTLQPTYPRLLEAMAEEFKASNYSIQTLIRNVVRSGAYQLATSFDGEWKDEYAPYYARKFVRVLTGPEVVDAVTQATGAPVDLRRSGEPVGRVKQLLGPADVGGRRGSGEGAEIRALLQSFFQSNRMTPPPTGNRASTLQALLMMNSPFVRDRVLAAAGGRVQELLTSDLTDPQIIEELYLNTLARFPNAEEKKLALDALSKDRESGTETVQWALLNSIEFVLNH